LKSKTSQLQVEINKIKNVTNAIFSGGTPSTKNKEYWNGDIPWLSSGETRNDFIFETEKTITQLGVDNSSTRLAKQEDVVIASAGQGNTRGQVSFCLIDTYINQSIIALRVKNDVMDPRFLFYNLKSRYPELRRISDSFSSRGSLTAKLLADLEISIPPLHQQKKISKIFYILDMKILSLTQQNQILEKIIQTVFKSWFLDFDGQTKFVDSELGKIPKGWKVSSLEFLCKIETGNLNSNASVDSGSYYFFTCSKENFRTNTYSYDCEAILLSGNNALGDFSVKYYKGKFDVYQRTYVLTLKNSEIIDYPYMFFTLQENLQTFKRLSVGTATKFLTMKILNPFLVLTPPRPIHKKFNNLAKPIFMKILQNNFEINNLKKIRDYLLPKLMSGEIRV